MQSTAPPGGRAFKLRLLSATLVKPEMVIFYSRLTRPARALRACKTLTARFADFFTDFEKKKRTVLQSTAPPGGRAFKLGLLPATLVKPEMVIKGVKSRYLLSF